MSIKYVIIIIIIVIFIFVYFSLYVRYLVNPFILFFILAKSLTNHLTRLECQDILTTGGNKLLWLVIISHLLLFISYLYIRMKFSIEELSWIVYTVAVREKIDWVSQCFEHHPIHHKDCSFEPWLGTQGVYGSNQSIFLSHSNVSLSFHFSL